MMDVRFKSEVIRGRTRDSGAFHEPCLLGWPVADRLVANALWTVGGAE